MESLNFAILRIFIIIMKYMYLPIHILVTELIIYHSFSKATKRLLVNLKSICLMFISGGGFVWQTSVRETSGGCAALKFPFGGLSRDILNCVVAI